MTKEEKKTHKLNKLITAYDLVNHNHTVAAACKKAGVPTHSYYNWRRQTEMKKKETPIVPPVAIDTRIDSALVTFKVNDKVFSFTTNKETCVKVLRELLGL